jgi:hypothetical protein
MEGPPSVLSLYDDMFGETVVQPDATVEHLTYHVAVRSQDTPDDGVLAQTELAQSNGSFGMGKNVPYADGLSERRGSQRDG